MGAEVKVMPALGTHMPVSPEEKQKFFGDVVPDEDILIHRWQYDTTVLGKVPQEVVSEISKGLYVTDIEVEVNHLLVDGGFDLILSVGQVVPHEVVGMANYSKNLFVGLGGRCHDQQEPYALRHLRYGAGSGRAGLPRPGAV